MTERLKTGVVGVGYLGSVHARIYNEMPDTELVAVADIDADTATEVAERHGCAPNTDPAALLGEVDAVSIAVPTSVHCEVALPFLEAGIPVLLEKPIASNAGEGKALVDAAARGDAPLLIGHVERFNPALRELQSRQVVPTFIEAHRLNQFVERAVDVDVITDLMIHDLEITLSLVGDSPNRIDAVGTPVLTDTIDIANVRLEFPNGAVANLTASRVSARQNRRYRVFGPSGYYAVDFVNQELDIARPAETSTEGRFADIETSKVRFPKQQPLQAEIAHFCDVARRKCAPLVDGEQGLKALELVAEIHSLMRVYSSDPVIGV